MRGGRSGGDAHRPPVQIGRKRCPITPTKASDAVRPITEWGILQNWVRKAKYWRSERLKPSAEGRGGFDLGAVGARSFGEVAVGGDQRHVALGEPATEPAQDLRVGGVGTWAGSPGDPDPLGADSRRGRLSRTTVTCSSASVAQRSSWPTSRSIAARRSRHQPSGWAPITFIASMTRCIAGGHGVERICKRPEELVLVEVLGSDARTTSPSCRAPPREISRGDSGPEPPRHQGCQ